jgi:hypothetical protein
MGNKLLFLGANSWGGKSAFQSFEDEVKYAKIWPDLSCPISFIVLIVPFFIYDFFRRHWLDKLRLRTKVKLQGLLQIRLPLLLVSIASAKGRLPMLTLGLKLELTLLECTNISFDVHCNFISVVFRILFVGLKNWKTKSKAQAWNGRPFQVQFLPLGAAFLSCVEVPLLLDPLPPLALHFAVDLRIVDLHKVLSAAHKLVDFIEVAEEVEADLFLRLLQCLRRKIPHLPSHRCLSVVDPLGVLVVKTV